MHATICGRTNVKCDRKLGLLDEGVRLSKTVEGSEGRKLARLIFVYICQPVCIHQVNGVSYASHSAKHTMMLYTSRGQHKLPQASSCSWSDSLDTMRLSLTMARTAVGGLL